MKTNDNLICFYRKNSYIVTNTGVKVIGLDNISNRIMIANLSRQRLQKQIDTVLKYGIGKQYV